MQRSSTTNALKRTAKWMLVNYYQFNCLVFEHLNRVCWDISIALTGINSGPMNCDHYDNNETLAAVTVVLGNICDIDFPASWLHNLKCLVMATQSVKLSMTFGISANRACCSLTWVPKVREVLQQILYHLLLLMIDDLRYTTVWLFTFRPHSNGQQYEST